MWCKRKNVVNVVDLTLYREINMDAARDKISDRYVNLLEEREDGGWRAEHFPIDAGLCKTTVLTVRLNTSESK